MADKSESVMTAEEKIAYAKELYGKGSRNYLVKEYAEAADDLSEVCALYSEIYGDNANELGMPYLLYAKSLIALAQGGENKLLEVPEEQEPDDDDEDDDDDGEEAEQAKNETAAVDEPMASSSTTKPVTNGTNGTQSVHADSGEGSSSIVTDAQVAGTADDTDAQTEEDDDSPAANLQVAWEVLELAVNIFNRQGDTCAANLADAYFELAEISLENSHFDTALRDYSKLFVFFFL